MKLDAGLGTDGEYLKDVDRTARAAEDLGFAGLWTSETKHDAFLPLAIAANCTQRLDLGTSVAIAFSRSPMETAQTAWDLQDLSGGRFILGLGTQVWVRYDDGQLPGRLGLWRIGGNAVDGVRWLGLGAARLTSRHVCAASGGANIHARRPYVVVSHRRPSGAGGLYVDPLLELMQDSASELRRIPLLRGWVNKGQEGGPRLKDRKRARPDERFGEQR